MDTQPQPVEDFDEDGLEDDGDVLEPDESVEDPPSEQELVDAYEGERDPEPDDKESLAEVGDDPSELGPENPDDPLIPDDVPDDDFVETDDSDPTVSPGMDPRRGEYGEDVG